MHAISYNVYRRCNKHHIHRTSLKKQKYLSASRQQAACRRATIPRRQYMPTRQRSYDKLGDSRNSTYFGSTEQISANEGIGRYTGSLQKPVVLLGRTYTPRQLLRFISPIGFLFQTPVAEHDQVKNKTLDCHISDVLKRNTRK